MPQYIDRDTGERVVIRHRRPSIMLAVLFVFALGLIVWLMIPASHGWISFNAPSTITTPLPKAPAGSVSGAASQVEPNPPQPIQSTPAAK
jgi:hypothetical protein